MRHYADATKTDTEPPTTAVVTLALMYCTEATAIIGTVVEASAEVNATGFAKLKKSQPIEAAL
jgi:hypothetical protein